jgi:hypothetical protein
MAGTYTRILIPWLYVVYLSNPFSFLPDLFKVQGKAFVIDFVKMLARVIAMVAGVYSGDVMRTLIYFSIGSTLVTAYQLIWYYNLAGKADMLKMQKSEKET